ncbi:hypothetical protein [Streptomyces sp. SID9124]|uniref:hypothetical protein n=1 Tax=Streptomyces sp. SID9124 TaxID=2706108 RepID=UPI0013DF3C2C|nr:hypothetical protein [Streptomyces sp. SID9124]
MSTYSEDRRADRAADAEQRRIDRAAADERRAERERVADERAARLREQERAERDRTRRARAAARAVRRAARGEALTAGNVYRKGTLALVTASALGSLPAQVLHFVAISPTLLPLPLAIEGAAWVMAAGVAYADERGLPVWVRWLLRSLVVAAAGFAASINYTYGTHLPGLSASDARTAGIGLAAVTLLGPLLFEVRQWVTTLSVKTGSAEDKAMRRHDRKRRRQHRSIALVADRLVSAAPFGALSFEDAFARAWEIETGTDEPGMTPMLHLRAARSVAALAAAQRPAEPARHRSGGWLRRRRPITLPAAESVDTSSNRSTADLGESAPRPVVLPAPVVVDVVKAIEAPRVRAVAAESPRPRRATGRVPAAARSKRPIRTADQLLDEARKATKGWPAADLTAEAIRKAVHTSPAKARVLRDTLRAERSAAPAKAA